METGRNLSQTQNLIDLVNNLFQAAHCLDSIRKIDVKAGVTTLFQTANYQLTVESRDTRQHPQYNRDTLINDIGLVFLRRRIQFSPYMQPVTLPRLSQIHNRFVGDGTTIIGWGQWGNEREFGGK